MAEIRNLDGILEPCEYDISLEFAYQNSTVVINETKNFWLKPLY